MSGQQLISFSPPDSISVCQEGIYRIEIEDSGSGNLNVICEMPEGFIYGAGDVIIGEEIDISDPVQPEFRMRALGGGRFELIFKLIPECEVYDLINRGTLFTMRLRVGASIIDLPPLDVQTPFLVLSPLPRLFISPGTPVDFPVEVQNTRLGILQSGLLRLQLPPSVDVFPDDPFWVNLGNNLWQLNVGPEVLMRQGDLDSIWDPDEWLRYNFVIRHESCQESTTTHPISLSASWGCDGNICQEDLETSVMLLAAQMNTRPNVEIRFEPVWNPCFCEESPSKICIFLFNSSPVDATDIRYRWQGNLDDRKRPHSVDTSTLQFFPTEKRRGVHIAGIPDIGSVNPGRLRSMELVIPELKAGDSVRWCMDVYTLDIMLSQRWMGFFHTLDYKSSCPPYRTFATACPSALGPYFHMVSFLDLKRPYIEEGDIVEADIVIDTINQVFPTGTVEVLLELPPGVRVLDSSFIYKGQSPVFRERRGREWFLRYVGDFTGYRNRIPFTFRFSCDELLDEFDVDTCITVWEPPSGGNPTGDQFPAASFCLYTAHIPCADNTGQRLCGVDTATLTPVGIVCDSIAYCVEKADRFWTGPLNTRRTNLGYRDNDNDRIADSQVKADHPMIRDDRFVAGDTMEVRFDGTLRTLMSNTKADTLEWQVFFLPGGGFPDGEDPDSANVVEFYRSLRFDTACIELEKRMTESYLKFPLPRPDTNLLGSFPNCGQVGIAIAAVPGKGFAFRIGPEWLKSKMLEGYSWEENDKIRLYARFVVGHNTKPPQELINFVVSDRLFTGRYPELIKFSPGPRYAGFQLVASRMFVSAETNWQDGCEPGGSSRMFQWRMNSGLNNAFPYEYRNLYLPATLKMPRLFNMTIDDVTWELYHEKDRVIQKFHEWPANYNVGTDTILFNFPQRSEMLWDENVLMLLRLKYRMELCLPFQSGATKGTWEAGVDLPTGSIVRVAETDTLKIDSIKWNLPVLARPIRANINLNIPNAQVTPGSDTSAWEFNLQYSGLEPGMDIGFQISNDRFEWIDIFSQNGAVGAPTSPDSYSWYPDNTLGSITGLVRLRQLSCVNDSVWLRFGWKCPDQLEFCYSDSIQIFSRPQGVEFELQIDGPTAQVDLCNEFPYHELWFYNADRAPAYFPFLEATLPPGLEYVSGSTEIRIGGQMNWQVAEDPAGSTGLIRWDAGKWLPSGLLASVDNAPENQIYLRFLTRPVCGFVSGDRINVKGYGDDRCGDRANQIERPGPALRVNTGVSLPPIKLEWSGADTVQLCSEKLEVALTASLSAPSQGQDSIWIYLPEGTDYVPGSVVWSTGDVPRVWTDSLSGRVRIRTSIPTGLTVGQLQMTLTLDPSLPCGPMALEVQTVQSVLLQCGNDPAPCPIFELTGRLSHIVHIQKNEFSLSEAALFRDLNGIRQLRIDLGKSGANPGAGLAAYILSDNTPTGIRDSSDRIVHSFEIPDSVWINGMIRWTEILPDTVKNPSCAWLLVIPALENCLCEDLVATIGNEIFTVASDTLCPGSNWLVGVDSVPGFEYTWLSSGVPVPCEDCSENSIFINRPNSNFSARLVVKDDFGCSSDYRFELVTRDGVPYFPEDTLTCRGQALAIPVLPGYEWEWSGPGIGSDPNNRLRILESDTTTGYRIVWKRADGCVFTDTMTLRVIPPPKTDLDSLILICAADQGMISVNAGNFIRQYEWSPRSAFENFEVNPVRLREGSRPTLISVLVTDSAGCVASDTAHLTYSDFQFSTDSIELSICEGDSIELEANNVSRFRWIAASGLSCDTCQNIVWVPGGQGSLWLVEEDTLGCSDTLVYSARLNPNPQILINKQYCEGDTIRIEDTLIADPGQYLFHYKTKAGCDSTRIFDVSFYAVDTPLIEGPDSVLLGDTVRWRVSGGTRYDWSGPFSFLDCNDCPEINFTVTESGYISLHFVTEDGCELVIRRKIRVYSLECPEKDHVFVPNAFTPNGDGMNDLLMVRGSADAAIFFVVYNRWGQELFRTNDPQIGWDGFFGGTILPPDTYTYYLELQCPNGEVIRSKGNVVLMR